MALSQVLQLALDMLFLASGAFAVHAIVSSWLAARPAIAALGRDLAASQSRGSFRYRIHSICPPPAQILPFRSPAIGLAGSVETIGAKAIKAARRPVVSGLRAAA